ARADYRQWAEASARFETNEEALNWALAQAVADLKALSVFWDGRRVISAGVPWYASPFGRDALITGFQALPVNPDIARDALLFLAAHQGKKADDFREEEPGKILHEIRRGELARTGEVPHTPYYGSVDSTPLFLVLYTEYIQWTSDQATAQQLVRRLDEAFWMEKAGMYALALDADKRQVQTVGSNAGHLLFSRAVPEVRARRVARTLLSPDSFSGFGIRTLAKGQRPYNPLSYHNGTIWPHDNSLIAMGL